MQLSPWLVISNLAGLFIMMAVGYGLIRGKILPTAARGVLTGLLLKVTLPCLIFVAMIRPYDAGFLRNAGIIFVLGLGFQIASCLLVWLLVRLFRVPKEKHGMWMMCGSFSSNGFMGFPVALALFGEEGLALAVILGTALNILMYTLGTKLVTLDRSAERDTPPVQWKKIIFSAINVATALSILFYLAQIPVPTPILTPLDYLGNMTTPLSMLIVGMNLAEGPLSDLFRDRHAISAVLTRLVLIPLLVWAVLSLLPDLAPLVAGVCLIVFALPSATVSVAMAEEYGGQRALGTRAVCLSNLLCIVTLPLIALLL